ncbi:MAG: hypothetical protein ACP5JK_03005, partial [Candidatus Aenigmatarchaeota archaeon]
MREDARIFRFKKLTIEYGLLELLNEEEEVYDIKPALKISLSAERLNKQNLMDYWDETWFIILGNPGFFVVHYYDLMDRHNFYIYKEV